MAQRLPCAEFGAEMSVRARDTAANVMYYGMGGSGSFLRMIGLPAVLHQVSHMIKRKISLDTISVGSLRSLIKKTLTCDSLSG